MVPEPKVSMLSLDRPHKWYLDPRYLVEIVLEEPISNLK
jgi:hypothetical protein